MIEFFDKRFKDHKKNQLKIKHIIRYLGLFCKNILPFIIKIKFVLINVILKEKNIFSF